MGQIGTYSDPGLGTISKQFFVFLIIKLFLLEVLEGVIFPKLKENFTNNLLANNRIKHVDLRYAQGFAVKTASKNKSVTYSKLKDSCLLNNKHRGLK